MASDREATPGAERPDQTPGAGAAVLLVDDDPGILRAFRRSLCADGHHVVCVGDGSEVPALLRRERFDAVVSDISMTGLDGFGVLREAHAHDPDLPVVLVTGGASLDAAIRALELGAHRLLLKPLDPGALSAAVREAVQHCQEGRAARHGRELAAELERSAAAHAHLGEELSRAVESLWMAFQPIVRYSDHGLFGFEALVRSRHPTLGRPDEILQAAEQLGRLGELGRAIHDHVARAALAAPPGAILLVNLHPWDLRDEGLLAPGSPLAAMASRVVLEITERASLEQVPDLRERIATLRGQGFRIAVDDLGAGYAGLACIADLAPDIVKLDMSLVRGVHLDPTRRRLVHAISALCAELGISVVAEGVETAAERDALCDAGCDLMQGFLFARPAASFVVPSF
jgi:EAL domain-containing protein (putative c-di-GMP-specific phosphodiesterase class I)